MQNEMLGVFSMILLYCFFAPVLISIRLSAGGNLPLGQGSFMQGQLQYQRRITPYFLLPILSGQQKAERL